jgi:hypothetical protein
MNKIFKNEWLSLFVILFLIITPMLSLCSCELIFHSLTLLPGTSHENGGGSPSFIWGHAYLPDSDDHSGIKVSLEGTGCSSITDTSGNFHISDAPDGTYNLVASKSGYTNTTSGPWVFPANHNASMTLGLLGNGDATFNSVWGHAYLPDSDVHSGINVSLEETSYSSTTDVSGYFYISGFPDGSYNLVASKSGYRNVTSGPWVFSPAHHGNVDLKLKSAF